MIVTTAPFQALTRRVVAELCDGNATRCGPDRLHVLVIAHPLGGVPAAEIEARAARAADEVVSLITGPSPTSHPVTSDHHDVRVPPAVAELQLALQADGARLELQAVDDGVAIMRLELADASCADCVMPRAMLERLVRAAWDDATSPTSVTAVRIHDPREADNR